jgi:hypothetical protein
MYLIRFTFVKRHIGDRFQRWRTGQSNWCYNILAHPRLTVELDTKFFQFLLLTMLVVSRGKISMLMAE